MFFNEDLYLEGNCGEDTITEEEIQAAAAEAAEDPEVSESVCLNAYAEGLEFLEGFNESYFNLREKMMQVEHVASLKAAEGLVSESEIILSESVDSFIEKTKSLFVKIKNLIISLFNKFVNFISSLTVSTKDVLNCDPGKAYDAAKASNPKWSLTVKMLNVKPSEMAKLASIADDLLFDAETEVFRIKTDIVYEEAKKIPKKIADRYNAKKDIINDLISPFAKDENQTVLQKQKVINVDKALFVEMIKFAKTYTKVISSVKTTKAKALKTIDDSIKDLNKLKPSTDKAKNLNSSRISLLRWLATTTSKSFSKLISVETTYYRQCVAIGKRVIGTGKADAAKKNLKSMTEGFDFDSYFAN